MRTGLLSTTVVLFAFLIALSAAHADKVTVSLPDLTWAVEIDAPDLAVAEREIAPGGERARIFGNDSKTQLTVSVFLEKAPKSGTAEDARAYYSEGLKFSPPKEEDIKTYMRGEMAMLEYIIKEYGPVLNQKHMNAYLARGPYWVDIHLSKGDYTPDDQALFTAFLERVKVNDAYVPDAPMLYQFGRVFFEAGNYSKAIQDLKAALDQDRAHPVLDKTTWKRLVVDLGISYGVSGDLQNAGKILEYGLTKEPQYPLFFYNLACVHAELGDMEEALEKLKQAYQFKQNLSPDEYIPDPRKDLSFKRFASDKRFNEELDKMMR